MNLLNSLTTTYSTLILSDSEDIIDISTTMCTTSATASTLGNPSSDIRLTDAETYMNSLSEEQLVELEEKLTIKEMELSFEGDTPKVKIYSDANQSIGKV